MQPIPKPSIISECSFILFKGRQRETNKKILVESKERERERERESASRYVVGEHNKMEIKSLFLGLGPCIPFPGISQ